MNSDKTVNNLDLTTKDNVMFVSLTDEATIKAKCFTCS